MKSFAVLGLGRFGTAVSLELMKQGCEVLAVDMNENSVQDLADSVTQAVTADLRDPDVIAALNLAACDCVIVSIASDISTSVLVTMNLKEAGAPCVISKASSEAHRRILEKIGSDNVIFPEQDFGIRLARDLCQRSAYDYVELSPEYAIVKIPIPKSWRGKSLLQLNLRATYDTSVLSFRGTDSNKVVVSPDPNLPLPKEGGLMTVLAPHQSLEKFEKL